MSQEEEKKHATVHMNAEEHKYYRYKAVDEGLPGLGPLFRAYARLADFVRPVFTREYLIDGYDRRDVDTMLHGGEPDGEWIERDVLRLSEGVPLETYQKLLDETEEACKQVIRFAEIKLDKVHEEQDRVEHLLEKEE